MKSVTISERDLEELRMAASKMAALDAGGVDNWEFYGEALEGWSAENELKENLNDLIAELSNIFGECAYEPSERGAGIAFDDDVYAEAMKMLVEKKVRFED